MGYHTDFDGTFLVEPSLSEEHREYLKKFNETRRKKRDPVVADASDDPVRLAAGLPIGIEGGYFVNGDGFMGQGSRGGVVDHNVPPSGQPGLWCQWVPTEDGSGIEWDCGDKFYRYIAWIEYLIQHFLEPWGYKVNGEVDWNGEDRGDLGQIVVEDNTVSERRGEVTYR